MSVMGLPAGAVCTFAAILYFLFSFLSLLISYFSFLGWVWSTPKPKMALGSRGSGEPWCMCRWLNLTWQLFHGSAYLHYGCTLSDHPLSLSWIITWGEVECHYMMWLGVNCKSGATAENQGRGAWYMSYMVCIWCLCEGNLTWQITT